MPKTYRRIKAVAHVDGILSYLAGVREPVSSKDVATAVGLPHGTVMCYLVSLAERGYVQTVGNHYKLGMKAASLWARTRAGLESEKQRISEQIQEIGG